MKRSPLEYAFFLLKIRDRSIGEIRDKMRNKKIDEKEIELIIRNLVDKKFLNDERFAENYVKNQLIIKPQGKYRLSQKLKILHVDENIIKEVLAKISQNSEKELAGQLAEKWLLRKKDDHKKYEKLGRYLIGRGFGYEIIKGILDTIKTNL